MSYTVTIDQQALPLTIRKHPRSRRMVIRYQPLTHSIALTIPRYVSIRQGLTFIEEKRRWIADQVARRRPRFDWADGVSLPLLGREYRIVHVGGRGVITIDGERILVPGERVFLPRRVRDWVKHIAHETVTALAHEKAGALNTRIGKITLRDTTSHWGSCNQRGNLSFSWRLIYAPREVMDYVVCHEVAHLRHMDHSPEFWALVGQLCPDYHRHKQWLKEHGPDLYTIGTPT